MTKYLLAFTFLAFTPWAVDAYQDPRTNCVAIMQTDPYHAVLTQRFGAEVADNYAANICQCLSDNWNQAHAAAGFTIADVGAVCEAMHRPHQPITT